MGFRYVMKIMTKSFVSSTDVWREGDMICGFLGLVGSFLQKRYVV